MVTQGQTRNTVPCKYISTVRLENASWAVMRSGGSIDPVPIIAHKLTATFKLNIQDETSRAPIPYLNGLFNMEGIPILPRGGIPLQAKPLLSGIRLED